MAVPSGRWQCPQGGGSALTKPGGWPGPPHLPALSPPVLPAPSQPPPSGGLGPAPLTWRSPGSRGKLWPWGAAFPPGAPRLAVSGWFGEAAFGSWVKIDEPSKQPRSVPATAGAFPQCRCHNRGCASLQVTMADRAAAERACKDPNPIIDGRKANVNLAYLGAKPRSIQTGEAAGRARL